MNKLFTYSAIFPIALIIFICIFFIPSFVAFYSNQGIEVNLSFLKPANISDLFLYNYEYDWPTPGYFSITSEFGYRKSPTTGASSYHGGIDIGAPERK